ncbi:hypothetical protein CSC82_09740 [Rhodobacteraceae bacterium 4F10]|nr:hypothetical protein CSC82_09740 [Rhodobacteraceae bacterium 4F10]
MPLFKVGSDIHFFCHIPKCAGASVEKYLSNRFGDLAFVNSKFFRVKQSRRWTKTSPQHVDAEALKLLFPKGWIKSSFGVVRHPVSRIRSAYDYHLASENLTPDDKEINDWIASWVESRKDNPFQFDNHLRTSSELILPKTSVFRLEDGLDSVVSYLDRLEGKKGKIRAISHENKSRGGVNYLRDQTPLTPKSLQIISNIFAEDFRRFGYTCKDVFKTCASKDSTKQKTIKLRWLKR